MANISNIPAETYDLLSSCSVDTDEDIFTLSCRVALIKTQFDIQAEKCKKIIVTKYLSDNEYIEQCKKNEHIDPIPIRIYISMAVFFIPAASLVFAMIAGSSLNTEGIIMIAAFSIFYAYTFLSHRSKVAKRDASIKSRLVKYSKERADHEAQLPNAKSLYEQSVHNSGLLKEYLTVICRDREALPEPYWQYGGEMLYLYTTRRADNVKEAINLWEQIMHQDRMEAEQARQGKVIDQTNSLAFEARQYAKQAMYNAEEAAYAANRAAAYAADAAFNSFLTLIK